jgi:predicted nucleotidyltransferase
MNSTCYKTSGLKAEELNNIISILKEENKIESAYLFGSRAKGNYRHGSDVDIVLKGKQLDHNIINRISYILNEETLMPYRFDIVNYDKIKNRELLSHISRNGKIIFSKR